jgi:CheY-like chemotaxis protein
VAQNELPVRNEPLILSRVTVYSPRQEYQTVEIEYVRHRRWIGTLFAFVLSGRSATVNTTTSKTILLVDDEEAFLLSLADGIGVLDKTLRTILATDGAMALDMLCHRDVDLLITDIKMPGIDGFELLQRVGVSHPDLQTMVMTSVGSPELESRARGLGIRGYFEKPLDLDDLVAAIRRVFAKPYSTQITEEG